MRFLIVSDIHGNRFGLEKVLSDAEGEYEQLLCLGDVVGYGAHPNECCEILRERNAMSLSGNHDAAALELLDIEWFNPVATAAILWTRRQLTKENRAWLQSLSGYQAFAEHKFEAVHGSLREPWEEYITGPDVAAPNLEKMQYPVCFFGHTHVAVAYACAAELGDRVRMNDMDWLPLTRGGSFDIEASEKYLINPGSCGQPRDGNRQARYALFDSESREIEVFAVDYDWDAARAAIIAAGLPPMLGDRLLHGR